MKNLETRALFEMPENAEGKTVGDQIAQVIDLWQNFITQAGQILTVKEQSLRVIPEEETESPQPAARSIL